MLILRPLALISRRLVGKVASTLLTNPELLIAMPRVGSEEFTLSALSIGHAFHLIMWTKFVRRRAGNEKQLSIRGRAQAIEVRLRNPFIAERLKSLRLDVFPLHPQLARIGA